MTSKISGASHRALRPIAGTYGNDIKIFVTFLKMLKNLKQSTSLKKIFFWKISICFQYFETTGLPACLP